MTDRLIENFRQAQRARWVLVVAAVVGIVASATLGMAFALGAFEVRGSGGHRNPGALVFFVAPFAGCMAIGYVVHAILQRRLSGIDDGA
jgi:hypothetical protein